VGVFVNLFSMFLVQLLMYGRELTISKVSTLTWTSPCYIIACIHQSPFLSHPATAVTFTTVKNKIQNFKMKL
jgi:hypothetical protein